MNIHEKRVLLPLITLDDPYFKKPEFKNRLAATTSDKFKKEQCQNCKEIPEGSIKNYRFIKMNDISFKYYMVNFDTTLSNGFKMFEFSYYPEIYYPIYNLTTEQFEDELIEVDLNHPNSLFRLVGP